MLTNWLLGNKNNTKSTSYIWNTIGGAFNAGQSAIILIFISHRLGLVTAGMVTIAYAVAQLFLAIAKYGVRNFQVTDVNEQYSFRNYFWNRMIALAASCIIFLVYLFIQFHIEEDYLVKGLIVLEVVILKLVDAVEDVYLGRYQQKGRLDIGAKIMALRLILSTMIICIAVVAGLGIHLSLLLGIISSIMLDIYFISRTFQVVRPDKCFAEANTPRIGLPLLKVCMPLCIGTTLSIYIGNAPKYMINNYMDEATQAIFGYIMMPVFVVTLLNQFIYQPMVKELGDLWEQGEVKAFQRKVIRQCLIVIGLTAVMMAGGLTVGLPILSLMYGTDLTIYHAEFAVLLLGGGIYALAYYLNVPITTIRRQNYIAVGYVIAALVAVTAGRFFVIHGGMMGAAVLYLSINVLLVAIYAAVLATGIRKNIKQEQRKEERHP